MTSSGKAATDEVAATAQAKLVEGLEFHKKNQLDQAREAYRLALALQPHHFEALHLLAVLAAQTGNPGDAVLLFDKAIAVNSANPMVHYNRGNALCELKRYSEAVESFDRTLRHRPEFPEAHFNRGRALHEMARHEEAVESYDRAVAHKPNYARALYERGNVLNDLGRHDQAIASYDRAIALDPHYAEAHHNRAGSLRYLKQNSAAIVAYQRAIGLKPNYADAYANLAGAYETMNERRAAAECYEKAIALGSDANWLYGSRLHARMHICDWTGVEVLIADLADRITRGENATMPFHPLALTSSPALQRKAAETYVATQYARISALPADVSLREHDKIRVGYYSADFRDHAVSSLTAELFERHDRKRFDLVAFSFGPNATDDMRRRIAASFDRFIDVQDRSDRQVALLSRELEIDIAVDLNGHTGDSRPGIFAYRAAPLQVAYLGYPGTMGAPWMDYLLADHRLIPIDSRQHYSEKIVSLPGSYQVNDSKRRISNRPIERTELGLPPSGFVFCSFNASFKITPATFDGWMRLLRQVDGSVLWLLEDNPTAAANLRREARNRGVAGDRLVFASRLPLPDHLARHRAADLFLDTLPYNAHTTASDALWAGLPVLTCMAQSFASRVAASLLEAVQLPELITTTQHDYEALALALATDPTRLANIRRKLEKNRLSAPLFDAGLFAEAIERAYTLMYQRCRDGLPPDHFDVER